MANWVALALEALHKAGASEHFVPGAKVRSVLNSLSAEHGEDLGAHLKRSDLTFGRFLEGIKDVKVLKRPGTDMLVGLEGAEFALPARERLPSRRRQLRKDVYEALTRITAVPFHYDRRQDIFSAIPTPDSIELSLTTLSELVSQRRAFAEGFEDEGIRDRLTHALDHSANPLAQFQRELAQLDLLGSWHEFNLNTLTQKLQDWANRVHIDVSPAWFGESPATDSLLTSQDVLARLSRFMTEDEIHELKVPFRAVEALYRGVIKPQADS